MRTVRLENLPVASVLAVRRHADDLLHEVRVIASGLTTDTLAGTPRRLAALVEELNERFTSTRLINRQIVDSAAASGDETVTLEVTLPVSVAAVVEQYVELLDQADEYCRRGELLTLALAPELVRFRRRILEETVRQLQ